MIKVLSKGKNHKAIDIGSFEKLNDFEYIHEKLKHTLQGKLFVGEYLGSTGSEISFRDLPPNTTIPFLHKHHKHEEIYIVLKGYGKFQLDDTIFAIKEGSVIRVSPDGSRTLRNDSEESMIYMVIQSHADTLEGYTISDGYRVKGNIKL